MKLFNLAIAGVTMLTGLAPVAITAPASAQHRVVVHKRTVVRHHTVRPRYRYRTVCHTQYRHHHRQRVCSRVRYRY